MRLTGSVVSVALTSVVLSMVQFYPGFEDRLRAALRDLVGDENERKVTIGMAKDGSGVGGAFAEYDPYDFLC